MPRSIDHQRDADLMWRSCWIYTQQDDPQHILHIESVDARGEHVVQGYGQRYDLSAPFESRGNHRVSYDFSFDIREWNPRILVPSTMYKVVDQDVIAVVRNNQQHSYKRSVSTNSVITTLYSETQIKNMIYDAIRNTTSGPLIYEHNVVSLNVDFGRSRQGARLRPYSAPNRPGLFASFGEYETHTAALSVPQRSLTGAQLLERSWVLGDTQLNSGIIMERMIYNNREPLVQYSELPNISTMAVCVGNLLYVPFSDEEREEAPVNVPQAVIMSSFGDVVGVLEHDRVHLTGSAAPRENEYYSADEVEITATPQPPTLGESSDRYQYFSSALQFNTGTSSTE